MSGRSKRDPAADETPTTVERTVEPTAPVPVVERTTEPAPPDPSSGLGYMRAVEDLRIGSTLCHAPGDLVPTENVIRNGWHDKVIPLTAQEGTEQVPDGESGRTAVV